MHTIAPNKKHEQQGFFEQKQNYNLGRLVKLRDNSNSFSTFKVPSAVDEN